MKCKHYYNLIFDLQESVINQSAVNKKNILKCLTGRPIRLFHFDVYSLSSGLITVVLLLHSSYLRIFAIHDSEIE